MAIVGSSVTLVEFEITMETSIWVGTPVGFESSLSEPTKHTQAWGQDGRRTNKRKIGKILELAFKKEERGMDKAKYKKKSSPH